MGRGSDCSVLVEGKLPEDKCRDIIKQGLESAAASIENDKCVRNCKVFLKTQCLDSGILMKECSVLKEDTHKDLRGNVCKAWKEASKEQAVKIKAELETKYMITCSSFYLNVMLCDW